MSTQAIGAAAAGTVVIGGGGATIAYAAGAFNGEIKYKNFGDYVRRSGKYRYIGQGATVSENDPTAENIKKLLEKESRENKEDYRNKLKEQEPDMNLNPTDASTPKPSKEDINSAGQTEKTNETDKVSKFVSKWCIQNKTNKPTPSDGKEEFTEEKIKQHANWSKFEAVCLELVSTTNK
ncbi:hypothetical protein [Candidatus Mycoplasma haematohominis]|uniref:Uncharacterized protein n=1 Tax=Candidatus Mycoplasma haematohominis TaxID=1494318 RepID=A0A478FTB6_9MOLU|nr:hypothetical protein [Candidatus Mycoplasma haemohominis]GCE63729.1 hypothetical protein MHSWG343_07290 [Candidatus Mycoplasma haemohominis]